MSPLGAVAGAAMEHPPGPVGGRGPRGEGEAPLMWNGGAATDLYYVHLTSPTFELESYTTAPAGRYDFKAADWLGFVDSTSAGWSAKSFLKMA